MVLDTQNFAHMLCLREITQNQKVGDVTWMLVRKRNHSNMIPYRRSIIHYRIHNYPASWTPAPSPMAALLPVLISEQTYHIYCTCYICTARACRIIHRGFVFIRLHPLPPQVKVISDATSAIYIVLTIFFSSFHIYRRLSERHRTWIFHTQRKSDEYLIGLGTATSQANECGRTTSYEQAIGATGHLLPSRLFIVVLQLAEQ